VAQALHRLVRWSPIRASRVSRVPPIRPARRAQSVSTWWRELAIVATIYVTYEVGRGVHKGNLSTALANGSGILSFEHAWHIAPEHVLNVGLAQLPLLAVVAAYFYSTMHYLITPAVLMWMYRSHPEHYRPARTALAISTILGLVGFSLAPTAPPRLLPGGGIDDTLASVDHWGWWSGEGSVPRGLGSLTNQLAAMPSLHVGWALWCGVLLALYASHRAVRWLGVLYPVLTTLVVLATGNHYLVDAVAGAAVMGLGAVIALPLSRRRRRIGDRHLLSTASVLSPAGSRDADARAAGTGVDERGALDGVTRRRHGARLPVHPAGSPCRGRGAASLPIGRGRPRPDRGAEPLRPRGPGSPGATRVSDVARSG
jgi:hypothetical protein